MPDILARYCRFDSYWFPFLEETHFKKEKEKETKTGSVSGLLSVCLPVCLSFCIWIIARLRDRSKFKTGFAPILNGSYVKMEKRPNNFGVVVDLHAKNLSSYHLYCLKTEIL